MGDQGQDSAATAIAGGGSTLVADVIVDQAMERTGLSDLGDEAVREALAVLVAAIESEAELRPSGTATLGAMLGALVEQRLRVVDFAAESDVVAYETLSAPIIVVGLPRTGTTMLSNLLAQDPMSRPLLGWEAATVAPPPDLAHRATDPRLRAALERDVARDQLAPDLAAKHAMGAALPTECVQLLAPSFASLHFETMLHIPSYARWLDDADMVEPYRFHHLQLRTLQTTVPTERWSLKSPAHLWHLGALRAVYPDARLIVTHRDPARVVPSVASLCMSLRKLHSDAPDGPSVGHEWRRRCLHAIDVAAPHLEDWDDDAVLHLPYAELIDDPVGSIERAYQRFGMELSDLGRRRMQAWSDQNPPGRFGSHRYGATDFGLDEGALRRDFGDYMTQYHVPTER